MSKARPLINTFNGGEISPKLDARVDYQRYYSSCRILENCIPIPQGGVMRRPGSYFVYEVKDSTKKVRLLGFHFSTVQAYILEFGENYIRFYKDNGIILSAGVPYEVVTTYTEAELFELKFVRSADVLYILHPSHPPAKLTRLAHASWTLANVVFTYDDPETITGATQANPCVVTVTGHGFEAGDEVIIESVVGMTELNNRLFSVSAPATNTVALKGVDSSAYAAYVSGGTMTRNPYNGQAKAITGITKANPAVVSCTAHGYTNGTTVLIRDVVGMTEVNDKVFTVTVVNANSFSIGVNSGAYGVYSSGGKVRAKPFTATNEYPSCGAFFEQRLLLALNQTVWGSRSGDYENFQMGSDADHSFSYTIASDKVDAIQWMIAQDYCMLGTIGGVWKLWGGSSEEPITPSSVTAKKQTGFGAMNIEPELVDDIVFFVQRGGRRVRELAYSFEKDGFTATDMSILAEHIAKGTSALTSGIRDLDYQAEPFNILWATRKDGQLIGLVRDKAQQVAGWCRQVTGKTDSTTWDEIESVGVITSESEEDQVWVAVKRTIDGATKRYVEYFKPHEFYSVLADYFGVDSGLTYDGGAAVTITGITNANPAVVTAASHGFSNGNKVRITGVAGMTDVNIGLTEAYTVAGAAANTFQLSGIDSTGWGVYTSGGTAQKVTNTVSGLGHLEGRTVDILIDGARHPSAEVDSGAVSLSWYGNLIHVGLPIVPIVKPMKLEAGGDGQTSQGKKKRVYGLIARFYETYSAKWGPDADHLDEVPFGTGGTAELFSGDKEYPFDGPVETEGDLYITQDGPFPMTILALIPKMETY